MTVVLLFFLAFLMASIPNANATTAVTVLQSLNKQLPLVARTGQPYSWTFLPSTFSSTEGFLNYTTSILPGWLSFDQATQTFHGTPSANDEGYPEITVTAHSADSSASSKFTICVTHASPPTLNLPLGQQFLPNKTKSLSSVLFLRNNSAIGNANPTLRIPPKWSFSVGIESNTFLGVSGSNVFYELRLANGSRIPDFMNFNSRTVTLDGVVPSADKISQPLFVPFVLYASDQEGYSSAELPFALVVADHELSLSGPSLPTINITIATPFAVSLLSAVDFTFVLVDGDPIQPSNISSLDIDVSNYSKWLRYDRASRTLSGTPGDDVTGTSPLLPVELTTIFNQTIKTNVSLNFVQSYFVLPVLPSIHLSKGDQVQTTLTQWFSKSNSRPGYDGTNITASFESMSSANFLRFDEYSTNLTGKIPSDFQSDSDHITVSFAAYSHITHTTSHTSLTIFVADSGNTKTLAPTGSNAVGGDGHRKLILALILSFGLIGGLCVLAGIFAIMRRWVRLEDTALVGEEGRRAWSEKDRRWYGMMLSPNGTRIIEKQSVSDTVNDDPSSARPRGPRTNYGGLGLSRVVERSQQTDSQEQLVSPGVMKKREFLARIKETVRQVSNKYARKQAMINNRPAIGKPILVSSTRASGGQPDVIVHSSSSNPSDQSLMTSCPGSTFLSGSPSDSTAEHSIPRRRLDFAPPRNPAQVHFKEGLLVRQPSTGSMG
jgi:axial budding pattern protein 2